MIEEGKVAALVQVLCTGEIFLLCFSTGENIIFSCVLSWYSLVIGEGCSTCTSTCIVEFFVVVFYRCKVS